MEAEDQLESGRLGAAKVISGEKKCISWSPSPSRARSCSTSVTSLAQLSPVDSAIVVTTVPSQGKPP